MNGIAILRSIPLAQDTREAWASAGVRVVSRKRIDSYVSGRITDDDTLFINLGIRNHIQQANVINPLEVIESVSRPTDIREALNKFLPPPPEDGATEYWEKSHGFGGSGSTFRSSSNRDKEYDGSVRSTMGHYVDYQQHIHGTEYRVNTVGTTVVQAHTKEGHDNWEWCGLQGIRKNGIIPLLKEAIETIPYGDRSLIGWDIIVNEERPYIIEANTSAGVNAPTAARIVRVLVDRYNIQQPAFC